MRGSHGSRAGDARGPAEKLSITKLTLVVVANDLTKVVSTKGLSSSDVGDRDWIDSSSIVRRGAGSGIWQRISDVASLTTAMSIFYAVAGGEKSNHKRNPSIQRRWRGDEASIHPDAIPKGHWFCLVCKRPDPRSTLQDLRRAQAFLANNLRSRATAHLSGSVPCTYAPPSSTCAISVVVSFRPSASTCSSTVREQYNRSCPRRSWRSSCLGSQVLARFAQK